MTLCITYNLCGTEEVVARPFMGRKFKVPSCSSCWYNCLCYFLFPVVLTYLIELLCFSSPKTHKNDTIQQFKARVPNSSTQLKRLRLRSAIKSFAAGLLDRAATMPSSRCLPLLDSVGTSHSWQETRPFLIAGNFQAAGWLHLHPDMLKGLRTIRLVNHLQALFD